MCSHTHVQITLQLYKQSIHSSEIQSEIGKNIPDVVLLQYRNKMEQNINSINQTWYNSDTLIVTQECVLQCL